MEPYGLSGVGQARVALVHVDVVFDPAQSAKLGLNGDAAVLVGVLERAGRLGGDPERRVHRELPLASQPVAEGLAFDERHGEPEPAGSFTRVQYREDMGMLEPGREPDLALEPLGAEGLGQVGVEDLEGDGTVVPEVVGEVHGGHAAVPQLAVEDVPVAQCVGQRRRDGHGMPGEGWDKCALGGLFGLAPALPAPYY